MPFVWINFPTGSSEAVAGCEGDPEAIDGLVRRIVEEATDGKASLVDEVYFEVGADRACALIKGLDDYIEAKAVCSFLGSYSAKKLLNPQQAKAAKEKKDRL
jgi:hypothetical protein